MYHGFGSESLNFLDSFGSALLEGYTVNLQKDQMINSFLLCFVPSVGSGGSGGSGGGVEVTRLWR